MLKAVKHYPLLQLGLLVLSVMFLIQFTSNCANNQQTESDTPATEDSNATSAAARAETGQELFVSYCQICHGSDGERGAMAEILTVEVPDLRYISARRSGTFPEEDLYMIIEGSTNVKGHGSLNMPLWGKTFKESEALDSDAEVSQRIEMLVNYLKSIQEEGPEEG